MVVSYMQEEDDLFSQNWKLWTNAENIHDGIITNGLLTRVGSTPGLHGIGSGTY